MTQYFDGQDPSEFQARMQQHAFESIERKPGATYFSEQKPDKQFKRKLRPSMTTEQIQNRQDPKSVTYGTNPSRKLFAEGSGPQVNGGTIATGLTNPLSPTEMATLNLAANHSEAIQSADQVRHGRKQFLKPKEYFAHYDDNIEDDTEVFYQDESYPLRASHQGHHHNVSGQVNSFGQPFEDSYMFQQLSNHHREIDLVLQSNFDDQIKKRMIEDIQNKFRKVRERYSQLHPSEMAQLKNKKEAHVMDKLTRPDDSFRNRRQRTNTSFHNSMQKGDHLIMTRRPKKGQTPGRGEFGHSDAVSIASQNNAFLLPEVTALAGISKKKNLQRGESDGADYRSPRGFKQKKKSRSPSPGKFQPPSLFTKRTWGNKYCGYCIKDEKELPKHHHHDRSTSSTNKPHDNSLSRHLKTKFTPGRIRRSHKIPQKQKHPEEKTRGPQKNRPRNTETDDEEVTMFPPDQPKVNKPDDDQPYGTAYFPGKFQCPLCQGWMSLNERDSHLQTRACVFSCPMCSMHMPVALRDQHVKNGVCMFECPTCFQLMPMKEREPHLKQGCHFKCPDCHARMPTIEKDYHRKTGCHYQCQVCLLRMPIHDKEKHRTEGCFPARDSHDGLPEKKTISASDTDRADKLTYEEYLAKQQEKFRRRYGKKLIVEDDYSQHKQSLSSKGTRSLENRKQSRDSNSQVANGTIYTLGNQSNAKKFIDMKGGRHSQKSFGSEVHDPKKKQTSEMNLSTSMKKQSVIPEVPHSNQSQSKNSKTPKSPNDASGENKSQSDLVEIAFGATQNIMSNTITLNAKNEGARNNHQATSYIISAGQDSFLVDANEKNTLGQSGPHPVTNRTQMRDHDFNVNSQDHAKNYITTATNQNIYSPNRSGIIGQGLNAISSPPTDTNVNIYRSTQRESAHYDETHTDTTQNKILEVDQQKICKTFDGNGKQSSQVHFRPDGDATPRTKLAANQHYKIKSSGELKLAKRGSRHVNGTEEVASANARINNHSPSSISGSPYPRPGKDLNQTVAMKIRQSGSTEFEKDIRRYNTQEPGRGITSHNPSRKNKSAVKHADSNHSIGKSSKGRRPFKSPGGSRKISRENSNPFGRKISNFDQNSRSGYSNHKPQSTSPVVRGGSSSPKKVMEVLTNGLVKIEDSTKLLINGSEVLSHQGIHGKIHQVGVGFGTGRHLQSRKTPNARPDVVMQSQKSQKSSKTNKSHRTAKQQQTIFMLPGQLPPDTVSVGVNVRPNIKSENLSAQSRSARNIGLSAMTPSKKSAASIGLSAKASTKKSVRDQMDQVSAERFGPATRHGQAQTTNQLLSDYLRKPMTNRETSTEHIQIIDNKPIRTSKMIQTIPQVPEQDFDDPLPLFAPDEPWHNCAYNDEDVNSDMSMTSQVPQPAEERVYVLELPNAQEPEEELITDDWAQSSLFDAIKESKSYYLLRKGLIEDDQGIIAKPGHEDKKEDLDAKLFSNLNPEGAKKIMNLLDVDYAQAYLRKSKDQQTTKDFYDKAKDTIIALTENMIKPDISLGIFFKYYQDVTRKNVIKLLLRCKRLYDARNQMARILVHVVQVEAILVPKNTLWCVLQDTTPIKIKSHFDMIQRTLKFLSHVLAKISTFQHEHKLFAGEFKFNRDNYIDFMVNIGRIIGGFLNTKRQKSPALQSNGLLLDDHEERNEQDQAYKEWLTNSRKEYGSLDLPSEEQVNRWLSCEHFEPKDFNDSRVAKALQTLKNDEAKHSIKPAENDRINFEAQIKPLDETTHQPGRTLISDQHIERMEFNEKKRETAMNLRMQPDPEFDYEQEQEKLKNKKYPGLALLKQKLTYDNELDGETVQAALDADIVPSNSVLEHLQSQDDFQVERQNTPVTQILPIKRVDSYGVETRSYGDYTSNSQKIRIQNGENENEIPLSPCFRDDISEQPNALRNVGKNTGKIKSRDYQSSNDLLAAKPMRNSQTQAQPMLGQPAFLKARLRPADDVSEQTHMNLPASKRHIKVSSNKGFDAISEVSDFTAYQQASQRIRYDHVNQSVDENTESQGIMQDYAHDDIRLDSDEDAVLRGSQQSHHDRQHYASANNLSSTPKANDSGKPSTGASFGNQRKKTPIIGSSAVTQQQAVKRN